MILLPILFSAKLDSRGDDVLLALLLGFIFLCSFGEFVWYESLPSSSSLFS